jgi:hypothetical protein
MREEEEGIKNEHVGENAVDLSRPGVPTTAPVFHVSCRRQTQTPYRSLTQAHRAQAEEKETPCRMKASQILAAYSCHVRLRWTVGAPQAGRERDSRVLASPPQNPKEEPKAQKTARGDAENEQDEGGRAGRHAAALSHHLAVACRQAAVAWSTAAVLVAPEVDHPGGGGGAVGT